MENQKGPTPLQLKLSLLRSLKEGDIDQTQKLLSQLSESTKTHPKMYEQFHHFVSEHNSELKEMESEEREQEMPPVIVDGDSDQSWVTDDSVSLSSEESNKEKEEDVKHGPRMMKNIVNSKSAVLLKPVKEVKKHFLVQPKPKENITSSTVNLRRSSPSSKLLAENKSTMGTSKGSFMTKTASKKTIKPYFPPINASKPSLKLN